MRQICLILTVLFGLIAPAGAEESPLKRLANGDESRGWQAVGKLTLGNHGFCTGTLIAPQLVLTAAHCLFDKETGARIDPAGMQFLAGWRSGRAVAYRGIRRAIAHPEYVYGGLDKFDRVAFDLALLELDQPIRLPSVTPFQTDPRPEKGDEVGVVSYAQDRSEAPSLQEVCHVLGRQSAVLVLSCLVDFGASGAPIFVLRDGVARIVSVVSAKADVEGQQVALGVALDEPLQVLREEMAQGDGVLHAPVGRLRMLSGTGGAKFLTPVPTETP